MTIREITDVSIWDSFVTLSPNASFVQSFAWGEFQRTLGRKPVRLALFDGEKCVAVIQWFLHRLPFGFTYAYAPYGPLLFKEQKSDWLTIFTEAIQQSKKFLDKPIFLLIEPRIELCNESLLVAASASLKLEKIGSVQPQDTRVLDLSKSEEELLSAMHQKTRYNIRLAEKRGVQIVSGNEYLDAFISLHRETSARDKFTTHSDAHFSETLETLPKSTCKVYVALFEKKVIAANMVVRFGETATYLHGASSSMNRDVMAPYLLQWRQIQDAKKDGFARYDFWGIAPSNRESSKTKTWEGITRFKNGFGGYEVNYVGAFVLPIRPLWYSVYRSARRLR